MFPDSYHACAAMSISNRNNKSHVAKGMANVTHHNPATKQVKAGSSVCCCGIVTLTHIG
jgi:hypothetical protein